MSEDRKPARTQETSVDIDASPEEVWKAITEAKGIQNWFPQAATVTGTGVGSVVTFSFGPEMTWPTTVTLWEPGRHLQWGDDGMMGPGTRLVVDYYLTTEKGKTRVRLVQSGFGESDGWDNLFAGTKTGWMYFMYNLRLYLERHAGRTRRMLLSRFDVGLPREAAWKKLLTSAGGLVVAAGGAIHVGDWVEVKLKEPATLRAVVDLIVDGHAIAMRIPDLDDSILYLEMECGETFSLGVYLSVYDEAKAREIDAPAKRTFERIKAAMR